MTNPKYNPNVPEFLSDALAITQPQMLSNFQALFNAFEQNHVSLTGGSTSGNHTNIQLSEQEKTPQTSATLINIYAKNVQGQTDQIFLRYENNGTEVQLTNYQIYSLYQPPNTSLYFTFLPGKLIVYFGSYSNPNNSKIVNFPLNPKVMTNVMTITTCAYNAAIPNKATVNFNTPENGIYKSVNFISSNQNQALSPFYFILIGNM